MLRSQKFSAVEDGDRVKPSALALGRDVNKDNQARVSGRQSILIIGLSLSSIALSSFSYSNPALTGWALDGRPLSWAEIKQSRKVNYLKLKTALS